MSEKKEIGIGREMHQEILAKIPVYANAAVADYVGRIGQQLARDSDRPGLEYTFTVLDSPDINAFATPAAMSTSTVACSPTCSPRPSSPPCSRTRSPTSPSATPRART